MIQLPVDEAYAFDHLAILRVKAMKGLATECHIVAVEDALHKQLGYELTRKVLDSDEYARLVKANMETFRLVELAKRDGCLASAVDSANHQRYLAKDALQRTWFDSALTENKTERSY